MAAAFVSLTTGVASRSVTVPTGTDRLLVVVTYSSSSVGARTVTYGGVTMDVANTANGWVQFHYMLAPTQGAATLSVGGGSVSTAIAAHYTGVGSYQASSGVQGSTASASFSPTAAAVIVMGLGSSSASHTPVASTNEREDSIAGIWFGDRIVTGSGAVTVGVTSATGPDYAGAIFLEPAVVVSVSGTPAAPKPTAAGTPAVIVGASGALAAPVATSTGTPSVIVSPSGAITAPKPTATGSATVTVGASGAISAPPPTATGTAAVDVFGIAVSGAPTAPKPTATGTPSVTVGASGAITAPTATATGTPAVQIAASGTPSAPRPTTAGTAVILIPASGTVGAPSPGVAGTVTTGLIVLGLPGTSIARSVVMDAVSNANVVDGGARVERARSRSSVQT